jgi:glycosyltransferase involved in cell wall biosynthesis
LAMLRRISSRCRDLNIHIVGEIQDTPASAVHHGLVTRRQDLFALLGRAKTLVCPSILDAAPGILFEACALGCNVVASKNCGNWRVCNENLLVDPFTLNGFVEKIRVSLARGYANNIMYYLAAESRRNLVDIISVF